MRGLVAGPGNEGRRQQFVFVGLEGAVAAFEPGAAAIEDSVVSIWLLEDLGVGNGDDAAGGLPAAHPHRGIVLLNRGRLSP
jgi:hypothetical protein